jgi:ABC-type transport system substrate-binding protein
MPIIPEYSNRYAQFVTGNIMQFSPTARDVLALAKDAPEAVIVGEDIPEDQISRIRFGHYNKTSQPWNDARVRIAIRQSIDFRKIGEFLSNKAEFETAGIPVELAPMTHLPRDLSYWLDPEKGEYGNGLDANLLFDPAAAKKLIEASGAKTPVNIQWHSNLTGSGQVPEAEVLVTDGLNQSGNFKTEIVRYGNTTDHRDCRALGLCDGIVQSGASRDPDSTIFRDYHSEGATGAEGQPFPDPRIDALADAQRRELDPQKRIKLLQDFLRLTAELQPAVPYLHEFTTFGFRWPWVRNTYFGNMSGNLSGYPVVGGHLQWLDPDTPRREQGAL